MPKRAKQGRVSPHVLRINDRVYQKYSPWNTGVVSHLVPKHSFTVVYDFPARRSGQPRQRFTYPIGHQDLFLIGEPPKIEAPPDVNVEGNGNDG
jgi:hypothetical protein